MLDLSIKNEPQFFIDFKSKNNAKNYLRDCDDKELKNNLREYLLKEQSEQCFYCEKKIENDISKVHIDHIKQRHHFHNLECEYSNLVLSCNGKKDNHCGRYKDNQGKWDDTKYFNFSDEKFENLIKFTKGKILPKKSLDENLKKKVQNTIDYLNLNYNDLTKARETLLIQIKSYGKSIEDISKYFNEFTTFIKLTGATK